MLLHPLWVGRKIAQIGQTESRRRTRVRQEVKFVQNAKHFYLEIRLQTNFFHHVIAFDS